MSPFNCHEITFKAHKISFFEDFYLFVTINSTNKIIQSIFLCQCDTFPQDAPSTVRGELTVRYFTFKEEVYFSFKIVEYKK